MGGHHREEGQEIWEFEFRKEDNDVSAQHQLSKRRRARQRKGRKREKECMMRKFFRIYLYMVLGTYFRKDTL